MKTFLFAMAAWPMAMCGSMAAQENVDFQQTIRPILSDRCFACHGPDAAHRKADLRLDDRQAAIDAGAIVPGNVGDSELMHRINSTDPDVMMPPPDFNKPLTTGEKAALSQWIADDATYQTHWSFVTPTPFELPNSHLDNPIDAFLQQKLAQSGLVPSPVADRETLIRRVTLDLTGLPPTPAEVDAFLADESDMAWENLVDGLLLRETYGEHMARYWLDLARYADTHGLHLDNERSMWPYRDWVGRAFNQNLSFDEFTRWQLAGDLLPNATRDQKIASGFNRCNVTTSEGGSINEEWIYRYAVDRTATAVEVWMGLTAGCAVCHDHKFDPLSTKEFYSLYAFFHSAADPAMDGNKNDTPPILRLPSENDTARLAELDATIARIDAQILTTVDAIDYTDPATIRPAPKPETVETIWFEDGFPEGAKVEASGGPPLTLITRDKGPVFGGALALTRTSEKTVSQDFFSSGASFVVPAKGRFFVHCYPDEDNPPAAIMVQFHSGGWKHRVVWGDAEKIPFGTAGTTAKVDMGPLPQLGQWTRLEFDAARIGLKAGMKVGGFAFTQFSGKVTWDRLGVAATTDTAQDPTWSWTVWKQKNQGKRNNDLPEGLRQLVRGKKAEEWTDDEEQRVFKFWLAEFYAGAQDLLAATKAKKSTIAAERAGIESRTPITFVMADLPNPRESFVMVRGQYDNPGEKVSRNVPAFLPPLPEKSADVEYDRLDLANWLVSDSHPLTSRVAVNRFWQQFFGMGLVKTSADFGSQGEPPSHPALLDWLAVQFQKDGWDVKKLVKRIVTSRAYRQSSVVTSELLARDPENRLLARGPRYRLDAEILRDQALQISGLLVSTIGGKGVKPYQPPNIWEPVAFGGSNTKNYKQDTGDALYRRSLYTFLKRTAPPPFMTTFDAPNREQSCTARDRSNTPLQALQLMNDIQHVEAARNFAERILTEGGADDSSRIVWAWRMVSARLPDAAEAAITQENLQRHRQRYSVDAESAKKLIGYGDSNYDRSLNAQELAAWTLVANLLLNCDEVVTKN